MLQQATNWAAGMQFVTVNFQTMIASVSRTNIKNGGGYAATYWSSQLTSVSGS